MNTIDNGIPEIMQNAEFVTIQFPMSNKARAKRALKTFAWTSAGTITALVAAIVVINHVNNKIPAED